MFNERACNLGAKGLRSNDGVGGGRWVVIVFPYDLTEERRSEEDRERATAMTSIVATKLTGQRLHRVTDSKSFQNAII